MPTHQVLLHRLFLLLVPVLACTQLLAAEETPDIESLMTAEELRATGVERLSDDQIEELNAWLLRYRNGEVNEALAEAPDRTDSNEETNSPDSSSTVPDVYPPPRERIEISSRISGNFEGWEGRTVFTLDNGQVWEQRRRGRWKTSIENPEVRLYQNFFGAWEMEVVAEDRSIGVRRIR